jgi:hypothetical protein
MMYLNAAIGASFNTPAPPSARGSVRALKTSIFSVFDAADAPGDTTFCTTVKIMASDPTSAAALRHSPGRPWVKSVSLTSSPQSFGRVDRGFLPVVFRPISPVMRPLVTVTTSLLVSNLGSRIPHEDS